MLADLEGPIDLAMGVNASPPPEGGEARVPAGGEDSSSEIPAAPAATLAAVGAGARLAGRTARRR